MFQSLDELVEENDCRRAIELDEAEDEDEPQNIDHTLEYIEPPLSSGHALQT
jgi:hypothetical protein